VTPISYYMALSAILFAIGVIGVLIRRNVIVMFLSIELMLNAVNLTFLTFARFPLLPPATANLGAQMMQGHAAVFFVIAVAAAEAAVGLAIVIAAFRARRSVNVDDFDSLRN
jgi:NADH-quinone oxidoreductase subunit K